LETLPNIDINIKNGNSLISRFPLDSDLKSTFKKIKFRWRIINKPFLITKALKVKRKREVGRVFKSFENDFQTEIVEIVKKLIL
jgi:hypothetical protein